MAQRPERKQRVVELTPDEIRLLLKACERRRAALPSYLQASQPEIRAIDALIRKLTA